MDIASCQLEGNADAVEFCPHEPFQNVLAVATYTLQEGDQPYRGGSVSLFSTDAGLELLHCVETVGVFDIRWSPVGGSVQPLLAQADAGGSLRLYSLESSLSEDDRVDKVALEHNAGVMLTEVCAGRISSAMCLCVDWHPRIESLSLGHSDGSLSVVKFKESELLILQSWAAHEYEVWATAFDTSHPQVLYTGSDDCCFSCWDLRENPSNLVFRNAKSHIMGVCCITQNPLNSNMLLTGCYDEHLRVWDARSTLKPVNEHSLCLGGGVWRIKHHPSVSGLVLAACMHNGFAIVRIGEKDATIVETYQKHNSLAYGADWKRGGTSEDNELGAPLVATCSFYDQLLRVWRPESLKAA